MFCFAKYITVSHRVFERHEKIWQLQENPKYFQQVIVAVIATIIFTMKVTMFAAMLDTMFATMFATITATKLT